jgi:hypothetical protein
LIRFDATQRLESLGKTIDPHAEAIALVSEKIFAAAPDGLQFFERGAHFVKGKQESLKVFQLIADQEGEGRRFGNTLRVQAAAMNA